MKIKIIEIPKIENSLGNIAVIENDVILLIRIIPFERNLQSSFFHQNEEQRP